MLICNQHLEVRPRLFLQRENHGGHFYRFRPGTNDTKDTFFIHVTHKTHLLLPEFCTKIDEKFRFRLILNPWLGLIAF